MLSKEFDIFKIEYTKDDLDYIDDLINNLKNNYKDIMNFFNNKEFNKKIEIKLWNNAEEYRAYLNSLYKEKGYNNTVPLWETARSFTDKHPKIYLYRCFYTVWCGNNNKYNRKCFFRC